MNLVLVLIDSLNRSALSAYGPTRVATPNLDAFARRAWRFDNHFVGSLPCMPARREIFSGFKELLWRPWGPLEPFDARLPRLLEGLGYSTAIVTDHYHYWEESANGYLQSFQGAELIRGHEIDFWRPLQPASSLPRWVQNIERWRPGFGRRYYSNVIDFGDETDFFPAKVMTAAADWLRDRPTGQPFFLQVESFDVHEPFDSPEPYASMYGDGAARDRFTLWPPYQDAAQLADFMDQATPEELAFVRSQYDGKVTMVDRWFGHWSAALDREGLWDDTCVIVTTDHGHDLGDRRAYGKQFPHYDSHANIPLLLWHPAHPGNGRAVTGMTSTVDLFATMLDAAGSAPPERTHSRSVLPLARRGPCRRPAGAALRHVRAGRLLHRRRVDDPEVARAERAAARVLLDDLSGARGQQREAADGDRALHPRRRPAAMADTDRPGTIDQPPIKPGGSALPPGRRPGPADQSLAHGDGAAGADARAAVRPDDRRRNSARTVRPPGIVRLSAWPAALRPGEADRGVWPAEPEPVRHRGPASAGRRDAVRHGAGIG